MAAESGIFRELHAAVVPVRDLDQSRRWYEEVLELEPRRVVPGFMAVYGTSGPTHICIYVSDGETEKVGYQGGGAFPNWRADDVEAIRSKLVARGVECTGIGSGGSVKFFSFFDPDSNRFDVCEYGPDWLE